MNNPNIKSIKINLADVFCNIVEHNTANHEVMKLAIDLTNINRKESDNIVSKVIENECKRLSKLN